MMSFKDILERLTGISCPIFGISWNPPEPDRKVAQRIIRFLEDKRVLYNPYELEVPEHCCSSVLNIRKYLTSEMQHLDSDSELLGYVKAMRIACRKFLDSVWLNDYLLESPIRYNHSAGWIFISALGELRGTFGNMLAQMAAAYGVDIEEDLAKILPGNSVVTGIGREDYVGFIPPDEAEDWLEKRGKL